MAEIAVDAAAVGQIVTYVAPGFFARFGYRARYPAPDRPAAETLVLAAALSLPIVAVVQRLLPGPQRPDQVAYALALLGSALILGYLAALARGTGLVSRALAGGGYRLQPEGSIYAQTLSHMSLTGSVVVELKDGRRVWGAPRAGPQSKEDGIAELYLTHVEAQDGTGSWVPAGPGLIVPISEISSVALSEDPTGR